MKRFVSYLYSTYNNQKIHNAGFARVELRTGRNRIDIHLRENGYAGKTGTVYLFIRKQGNIQGIPIGNIIFRGSQADFRYEQPEENIGQTPWQIDQMHGILIMIDDRGVFLSQWDEEPIDTSRFIVWKDEAAVESQPKADLSTEQGERNAQAEDAAAQNQVKQSTEVKKKQNQNAEKQNQKGQNAAAQNAGRQNTAAQNAGRQNAAVQDEEKQNTGKNDTEVQSAGNQNASMQNTGRRNMAVQNAGRRNLQIRNAAERNETGQSGAGQSGAAQSRAGQNETGQSEAGQSRAGQNETGQSRAGQNETGQNEAGKSAVRQDSAAQNTSQQNIKTQNAEADNARKYMEQNTAINMNQRSEYTQRNNIHTGQNQDSESYAADEKVSDLQTAELQPQQSANMQWDQIWRYMLRTYPALKQFSEKSDVLCVRIEIKDVRLLPEKYWSMINNSFLLHGFFNYRHLAFGRIGRSWFVGIPGIYQNQEHVMASIFGFPDFLPQAEKNERGEQPGYWYRILDIE